MGVVCMFADDGVIVAKQGNVKETHGSVRQRGATIQPDQLELHAQIEHVASSAPFPVLFGQALHTRNKVLDITI